ncbi:hypothetical protein, partial [Aeromonas veronii]|uniref:hypothetical protein n=1 Tax=Aeromonas veronii TaxID=654 RepID=UPI003D21E24E
TQPDQQRRRKCRPLAHAANRRFALVSLPLKKWSQLKILKIMSMVISEHVAMSFFILQRQIFCVNKRLCHVLINEHEMKVRKSGC